MAPIAPTRLPRILLVDDDTDDARVLADLLADLLPQVEIFIAADADEAAEIIESEPVDVLVTDVMMPRRSGLDLVRDLRDAEVRSVRVIVVSGLHHEVGVHGVDAWHAKPVDAAALARDIVRLLDLTIDRRSGPW